MLICTLMGEICLVAVQQKINRYGFLLLHMIVFNKTRREKGVQDVYWKMTPLRQINKIINNVNIKAMRPTYSLVRQYLEMLRYVFVA